MLQVTPPQITWNRHLLYSGPFFLLWLPFGQILPVRSNGLTLFLTFLSNSSFWLDVKGRAVAAREGRWEEKSKSCSHEIYAKCSRLTSVGLQGQPLMSSFRLTETFQCGERWRRVGESLSLPVPALTTFSQCRCSAPAPAPAASKAPQ